MLSRLNLSGIWVALVTPFEDSAQAGVDHAALRRLVTYLKQTGIAGFVPLGSTGEAAALSDDEQNAVLDTVLSAADGMPVVAGLAGNHVGHLHTRLAHLNTLPLAGVLSPAPSYVRPSQAGLVAHFKAMAGASRAPLLLYDIPYRTSVQMSLETILALAAHPNIHGIKDCGGSMAKTQALIADGQLQVLSGEDGLIFHNLCLGGAGAITAAAQVEPDAFVAMYRAIQEGQLADARQWQHRLAPLITALFAEPNPAVVKQALHDQGLLSRAVRPPMLPASDASCQALRSAWPSA